MCKYDYLIVGCGLAGAVMAHELKSKNYSVLIIDKRSHIGGNVYSKEIEGIHVHKYGPHIFHTNKKEIWEYVNKFDKFQPFTLQTVASAEDGNIYDLPFNLHTFYQVYGCKTKEEVIDLLKNKNMDCTTAEEFAINQIGEKMYKLLVKGYTEKQWGTPCSELDPKILQRLPIRMSWDNNYFNDEYQGIPKNGYTSMIEKMVEGITVELNTSFDLAKHYNMAKHIIYCGSIDELLDFKYGVLPYRSLEFVESCCGSQDVPIINYPDPSVPYTRSVNHKMFLNKTKNLEATIITKEIPRRFDGSNERYYPINNEANDKTYNIYLQEIQEKYPKIIPLGRLGTYKYLDMDKVIESALELSNKIYPKLTIWQVYHDANVLPDLKEGKTPYYKSYCTKSILEEDNINHIQNLINEFVCQYYVYKNNVKSNMVGFCHYGKYFGDKPLKIYAEPEFEVNQEILKLDNINNDCVCLKTCACTLTPKDYCYQLLQQYIKDKYPDKLEKLIYICENSQEMIRFESFICEWDDFCKYMEFMLGFFEYIKLPLNKETSANQVKEYAQLFHIYNYWGEKWYCNQQHRFVAYFIEIMCGIYWELFDYNVISNYL